MFRLRCWIACSVGFGVVWACGCDKAEDRAASALALSGDGGVRAVTLLEVSDEPPGENCAAGGQRIEAGSDADGDGELGAGDEVVIAYVCHGRDGSDGAVGEVGPSGDQGDEGADGRAGAPGEDGEPGARGKDGEDGDKGEDGKVGASAVIDISPVPAGDRCAEGGHRIQAGVDLDDSGTLDPDEVETAYVCNGQDADAELEIAGLWHELGPFGGLREITSEVFLYGANVVEFDNDDNYAITQYPQDDPYNPGKFGKTYWTPFVYGGFYYCTSEYSLDTLEEARRSTNAPDPDDLSTCGVGAWSHLIPVVEIRGRWHSNFGGTSEITNGTFLFGEEILQVNNEQNYVVTRNAEDAMFNPGKYGRSHWTEEDDGVFYYCTIEFDLDSLEEARMLVQVPDGSDPEIGGCGGFPWTRLEPPIEIEGMWLFDQEFDQETELAIDSDAIAGARESAVVAYSNGDNRAILRGPVEPPEESERYSVMVWTEREEGELNLCWTEDSLATLEEAQASTKTADTEDLEAGCGGGPWIRAVPVPVTL